MLASMPSWKPGPKVRNVFNTAGKAAGHHSFMPPCYHILSLEMFADVIGIKIGTYCGGFSLKQPHIVSVLALNLPTFTNLNVSLCTVPYARSLGFFPTVCGLFLWDV